MPIDAGSGSKTINGLFKAEAICRRGPWRFCEAVEYVPPKCVDWFDCCRLMQLIGNMPPAEAEALLCSDAAAASGRSTQARQPRKTGAVQPR